MRRVSTAVVFFSLVVASSSCARSSDSTVLVSAAASLTDAFSEIEAVYEEAHADVDIVMNFGGSSTLREQILEGAPVDVFASANLSNMSQLVEAGVTADDPVVFAKNMLQITVPFGNPAGVTGLADLADDDLLIGLCAEEVPCGEFARQVLANAGVTPVIDSNEPDVRALLTKIEAGELDAGITYVSDVRSTEGAVEAIDIPARVNVVADYPIAVMGGAGNRVDGTAFVEFVLSEEGEAILSDYGFGSP
jgi:molybdate transport system substrate-binding protein